MDSNTIHTDSDMLERTMRQHALPIRLLRELQISHQMSHLPPLSGLSSIQS